MSYSWFTISRQSRSDDHNRDLAVAWSPPPRRSTNFPSSSQIPVSPARKTWENRSVLRVSLREIIKSDVLTTDQVKSEYCGRGPGSPLPPFIWHGGTFLTRQSSAKLLCGHRHWTSSFKAKCLISYVIVIYSYAHSCRFCPNSALRLAFPVIQQLQSCCHTSYSLSVGSKRILRRWQTSSL